MLAASESGAQMELIYGKKFIKKPRGTVPLNQFLPIATFQNESAQIKETVRQTGRNQKKFKRE
jgi:hypothetical protein